MRQTADVGRADARLAEPRGRPSRSARPTRSSTSIKTVQRAISLETLVIHVFYGGMPREKAERSLRLFAEKVLPEVQAMDTPINPESLGRPAPVGS